MRSPFLRGCGSFVGLTSLFVPGTTTLSGGGHNDKTETTASDVDLFGTDPKRKSFLLAASDVRRKETRRAGKLFLSRTQERMDDRNYDGASQEHVDLASQQGNAV